MPLNGARMVADRRTHHHGDIVMLHFAQRLVLVSGLTLGLGFGISAAQAQQDPCSSLCQEIMNDCLAQAVNSTRHCYRLYRECLASCSQQ